MKLDYLVTGTGRCGTVFMARYLTTAGWPCGHEMFFNLGGLFGAERYFSGYRRPQLSWVSTQVAQPDGGSIPTGEWVDVPSITSDSSYFAAPFLGHEILNGTKFIHVVRHPVRVVNSFVNAMGYFNKSVFNFAHEGYIADWVPEIKNEMTPEERACLYYVHWNEMIEEKLKNKTYLFQRIEDNMEPVLEFIGKTDVDRKKLHDDTETNSWLKLGKKRFQLAQLPEGDIKKKFVDIGERYGYQMSSEYLVI